MRLVSVFLLVAVVTAQPAKSTWVVPNFRDLTIKTRQTHGFMQPKVTTWFFKGPRERIEHVPEASRVVVPFMTIIFQCDQRTLIRLYEHSKTYSSSVSHAQEHPENQRARARKESTGPDVSVTFDSVDTGEQRQYGSYEARHVKTTITIEPTKGAATQPGKTEIDGCYLDLPGLNCRDNAAHEDRPPGEWLMLIRGGALDHLVFKHLGTAPRGLAVEESATQKQAGNVVVSKTELLKISEQPLDESLFEVPSNYNPAEKHMSQMGPDPQPSEP